MVAENTRLLALSVPIRSQILNRCLPLVAQAPAHSITVKGPIMSTDKTLLEVGLTQNAGSLWRSSVKGFGTLNLHVGQWSQMVEQNLRLPGMCQDSDILSLSRAGALPWAIWLCLALRRARVNKLLGCRMGATNPVTPPG